MSVEEGELALPMRSRLQADPAGAVEHVRRAKAGDTRAFEALMREHERQVLRTAWRLLGSRDDARDAAQEVFLRLFKYLHRFDERRELAPWLYRVTVNVCRDMERKRRKAWSQTVDPVPPVARDAEAVRRLSQEERMAFVEQALKLLPQKERAAIVLRDIEGLPTNEVARILGSSQTTVRTQISRGRVKLKQHCQRLMEKDNEAQ